MVTVPLSVPPKDTPSQPEFTNVQPLIVQSAVPEARKAYRPDMYEPVTLVLRTETVPLMAPTKSRASPLQSANVQSLIVQSAVPNARPAYSPDIIAPETVVRTMVTAPLTLAGNCSPSQPVQAAL